MPKMDNSISQITKALCSLLLLLQGTSALGQLKTQKDSIVMNAITALNDSIDQAIIQKDSIFLRKAYSDDFHFYHHTGRFDNKQSWLRLVLSPQIHFKQRTNSKVHVDLTDNDNAVVSGLLLSESGITYLLPYVRMYRKSKQGQWQQTLHRSIMNLKD